MNVAGLNNLGFAQVDKKSTARNSTPAKGEASHFNDVLNQKTGKPDAARPSVNEKAAKSESQPEQNPAHDENSQAQQPVAKESQSERKVTSSVEKTAAKAVPKEAKSTRKLNAHGLQITERPQTGATLNVAAAPNMAATPNVAATPKLTFGPKPSDEDGTVFADGAEELPAAGLSAATPPLTSSLAMNAGVGTAVNPANLGLNKVGPNAPPDDGASPLARRAVWNDFLRKMNDLGVSVEDVLHAFSTLNKDELAQPPEKSVDKLVMALGLDGHQAQMARQAFNDLLAKTKSKSLGEELEVSNRQVGLGVLSQLQLQRKSMQRALENMDRDFFMDRPGQRFPQALAMPQNPNELRETGERNNPEAAIVPATPFEAQNPLAASRLAAPSLPGIATPTAAPTPMTPQAAAQMNELTGQMQPATQADQKSVDQLIRQFQVRPPVAQGPVFAQQVQGETANLAAAPRTMINPAAAGIPAMGAFGGLKSEMFSGGGKENDDSNDTGTSAYLGALPNEIRNPQVTGPREDFQTQMAQGAPQQMPVPELMQQAKIMVHEGGGDMKVTLHPEGLGEVAMRVSVEGNKVNVQMITESDEAKKLIERQISELKTGLANNHLQVESIKVDTATNLGRQLEQQYEHAQRQQQQASMEQFRQDHQGWRRSFFDTGTVNPYTGQGEGAGGLRSSSNGAAAKTLSNRRLDLVA